MKNLYLIFTLFLLFQCSEKKYLPINNNTMPSKTIGSVVPNHPNAVDEVHLTLSGEIKQKGKSAMRSPSGLTPTDTQISAATIAGAALYPSSFVLPCPPVLNQGSQGSCVAFQVGYYCRSIDEYTWKGASSFDNAVNVFSPAWLYDQTKATTDCGSGSSTINALNFIRNNGDVLYATMPYDDQAGCALSPTAPQQAEAANYKIGSYGMVIANDISAIKSILYSGRALTLNIAPDDLFYNADANFIWKTNGTTVYAPHAITIIGWDDTKNAVKIVNQWGTTWGDQGFSWIDYQFLGTITYDLYYMNPVVTNTSPVANAGFDQSLPATSALTLDGSASYDPDGYLTAYAWSNVSGPTTPSISNSTSAIASVAANTLVAGTYVFKLTVTDNSNTTAIDTCNVIVVAAESITLNQPTKITVKGKLYDVLTWNIALNNIPQYAELQTISSTGINPATLYPIIPFVPVGTYSNLITAKKPPTRYYRVQVIKSNGSIVYSNTVSIK